MYNTGYKGYDTLEEYFIDNGLVTGNRKYNLEGDPNYIAPVLDTTSCPNINNVMTAPHSLSVDWYGNSITANILSNYANYDIAVDGDFVASLSKNYGDSILTVNGEPNPSHIQRPGTITIFDGANNVITHINLYQKN